MLLYLYLLYIYIYIYIYIITYKSFITSCFYINSNILYLHTGCIHEASTLNPPSPMNSQLDIKIEQFGTISTVFSTGFFFNMTNINSQNKFIYVQIPSTKDGLIFQYKRYFKYFFPSKNKRTIVRNNFFGTNGCINKIVLTPENSYQKYDRYQA